MSTGIFPHDFAGRMRDYARMVEVPENDAQKAYARVVELAAKHKLSPRYFSIEATGKPDMIRDMKRGRMPSAAKLRALAEVMRTTVGDLLGQYETLVPPPARPKLEVPVHYEGGAPVPPAVPILGTALGSDLQLSTDTDGVLSVEMMMLAETQEVGRARRLPGLEGKRDIYAVFIRGTSMEPRFRVGEVVFVDPHRPPSPGDDVIVQLHRRTGDHTEFTCSLVKTLVKQTREHIDLQQYEPRMTFRIDMSDVARVHRIVPTSELVLL